jgi:hypothetical protein
MLDSLPAMGLLTVAEIVGPTLLAAGLIYGSTIRDAAQPGAA